MKPLTAFLRTLLPAQGMHMVLLVGTCFLSISQAMPWWPTRTWAANFSGPTFLHDNLQNWAAFIQVATLPILLAAAAGYFVCFWPGANPVRRLFRWVLVPGMSSILVVCAGAIVFAGRSGEIYGASILESSGSRVARTIRLVGQFSKALGPGLEFAIAGLFLVTIAVLLLRRGHSSLPVSSYGTAAGISLGIPDPGFQRQQRFIWYVLALNPIATILFIIPGSLLFAFLSPRIHAGGLLNWSVWVSVLFASLPFLVAALWAMGPERRQILGQAVRLPPITIASLAVGIPVTIAYAVPVISVVYDRIRWATYYWGRLGPPGIKTYFTLPPVHALWYFPAAFIEEIVWRGYLQPRFIRRFGIIRGIFFVGIVWAAFHFYGDFRSSYGLGGVLHAMTQRLVMTVVLSFTLAWVTLRAKSFVPAALMHATYNSFLNFSATPLPIASHWIMWTLWAAMGFVLFRYWPPQGDSAAVATTAAAAASPEPEV